MEVNEVNGRFQVQASSRRDVVSNKTTKEKTLYFSAVKTQVRSTHSTGRGLRVTVYWDAE